MATTDETAANTVDNPASVNNDVDQTGLHTDENPTSTDTAAGDGLTNSPPSTADNPQHLESPPTSDAAASDVADFSLPPSTTDAAPVDQSPDFQPSTTNSITADKSIDLQTPPINTTGDDHSTNIPSPLPYTSDVHTPTNVQSPPPSTDTSADNKPTNVQSPPSSNITYVNVPDVQQSSPTNTTTDNKAKPSKARSKETVIPVDDDPLIFQPTPTPTPTQKAVAKDTATSNPIIGSAVSGKPTDLEPEPSPKPPVSGPKQTSPLVAFIRKSPGDYASLIITLIISLLQLIIGWRYADHCPVHWRIPHYLVVAGTVGLAITILGIIQRILKFYTQTKPNQTDPGPIVTCGSTSAMAAAAFLSIFTFGWFIAGCFWVFRVWNKVQYKNPGQDDYCHPTLYRFAFWLLFLTICYTVLVGYRMYKEIRRLAVNKKKGPAILVPTEEP